MASTIDGSTVAVDAATGKERWRIVGPTSFPGFADDLVLLVSTVGGSH
jgi:outer membrane protein assembly factor BamB